jgi:hypothetical protein
VAEASREYKRVIFDLPRSSKKCVTPTKKEFMFSKAKPAMEVKVADHDIDFTSK